MKELLLPINNILFVAVSIIALQSSRLSYLGLLGWTLNLINTGQLEIILPSIFFYCLGNCKRG